MWRIVPYPAFIRALKRLDRMDAERILKFLHERAATRQDPRKLAKRLVGADYPNAYRFRIGDFRVIVEICDGEMAILALNVAHRREIYSIVLGARHRTRQSPRSYPR